MTAIMHDWLEIELKSPFPFHRFQVHTREREPDASETAGHKYSLRPNSCTRSTWTYWSHRGRSTPNRLPDTRSARVVATTAGTVVVAATCTRRAPPWRSARPAPSGMRSCCLDNDVRAQTNDGAKRTISQRLANAHGTLSRCDAQRRMNCSPSTASIYGDLWRPLGAELYTWRARLGQRQLRTSDCLSYTEKIRFDKNAIS